MKSVHFRWEELTNYAHEPYQELVQSRGPFSYDQGHGFEIISEKYTRYPCAVIEVAGVIGHSILFGSTRAESSLATHLGSHQLAPRGVYVGGRHDAKKVLKDSESW